MIRNARPPGDCATRQKPPEHRDQHQCGKADDLEMMAGSMDPDALGQDMAGLGQASGLGPNPFAGGGLPGLGGSPALPGLGGGMPGLPSHGGKKKDRKKGKKR